MSPSWEVAWAFREAAATSVLVGFGTGLGMFGSCGPDAPSPPSAQAPAESPAKPGVAPAPGGFRVPPGPCDRRAEVTVVLDGEVIRFSTPVPCKAYDPISDAPYPAPGIPREP